MYLNYFKSTLYDVVVAVSQIMKLKQISLYENKTMCFFLTLLLCFFVSQDIFSQDKPLKPHSDHASEYCSRAKIKHLDEILSSEVFNDSPLVQRTAASCTYSTTAEWSALSSYELVKALQQSEDADCFKAMFKFDAYSSPILFTNEKVKAVANKVEQVAYLYNGTNDTNVGLYGLIYYLRAAKYTDFNEDSVTFTEDVFDAYKRALNNLATSSSLFKINKYALFIMSEYFKLIDDEKYRHEPNMINSIELALKDILVTRSWKTITDDFIRKEYTRQINNLYNCLYRKYDDLLETALVNDDDIINLLGQAAVDTELINGGELYKYLWQNATGALSRLAESKKLIGKVEPHLVTIIKRFDRLSPQWFLAMNALNEYGDCAAYNLCQNPKSIKREVEEYLFPKTVTYDDGKMKIRTPLSDERIQNLYHAAKQVQNQFFRMIQTDEPVAGDTNETINMIVFGSKQQYKDYAPILFNIKTDNGGMYIESKSTFYTWDRRVPEDSSLSLEALFRHEYCHYLQGRYLIPGLWGVSKLYDNSRLVWYVEGMAELFAASTDTDDIKMLGQSASSIIKKGSDWPTLNRVFNSTYSDPEYHHYTYGNAAWYNFYLNHFELLKRFFDYTRNDDVAGFDNLVQQLRSTGETSYTNFLNQVKNKKVVGWQPSTDWADDNSISISKVNDIKNEMGTLPNTSNVSVKIDAEGSYRRFRIEGKINGTKYTNNNPDAVKELSKTLNNVLLELRKNEKVNNFKYTVGYFKNLNFSGSVPTANFIITGPLKDSEISDDPIANFSVNQTNVIVGKSVMFNNESTGYATELNWSFPSGSPSYSNKQSPEIIYNTVGKHDVSLTVKGTNASSNKLTKDKYITVYQDNPNTTYCDASNTHIDSSIYITKVALKDIAYTSDNSDYSDFTSKVIVVKPGQTNELLIKTLHDNWKLNALGVWIDWNQDGDFEDAGEEVMHSFNKTGPYIQNIIPPSGVLGTTRMRVRLGYGSDDVIVPCGVLKKSGEVEDYSLVITNDSDPINKPPVITLLKPSNGQTFMQKENIAVETSVIDDEMVDRVELRVDGELISVDNVAPYQWSGISKLNFLKPGQREFKVTAYDNKGLSSSESVMVNIAKAPIIYCDASTTKSDIYINRVVFGTTNKIDNSSTHKPYSDHTNLSTIVQIGEKVPFTINTSKDNWDLSEISIWIDWNEDGYFIENDDEVFYQKGIQPYTNTITVPASASTGVPLRMRIRLGYGGRRGSLDPCGVDTSIGEVEDYIIYVGNKVVTTCDDGIQNGDETGVDCGGSCKPCKTVDTYCEATSNTASEYISKVELGTINNSSEGSINGYSDFTSISTDIYKNISNTITITPKWISNVNKEAYAVWIDYDQDGVFSEAEKVLNQDTTESTLIKNVFTIPESAKEGATRMRVIMNFKYNPSPCGAHKFGEVEDYTVNILSNDDNGVVYVDMEDVSATYYDTWKFFTIEKGDNKDFKAVYSNNILRLETYNKDVVCEGKTNNISLIEEGVEVGPSSNFVQEAYAYNLRSSSYRDWEGKSGYIGFSFKINGNTHYGWFYVIVNSDGYSYTILNYAYNTNPNEGLKTLNKDNNPLNLGNIVKVYPNPFRNNITINLINLKDKEFSVSIYDILEKRIYEKEFINNPKLLSIGDSITENGIYFVKIVSDTYNKVHTIVKQ